MTRGSAAKCSGRHASDLFEDSSEVTLIRKARGQRNRNQVAVRLEEFLAGKLDLQIFHVVANCLLMEMLEHFGEVKRVDADFGSHGVDCQVSIEISVQEIHCLCEPLWLSLLVRDARLS